MPRRRLTDTTDDPLEINLSPMIDCIFILLIFFIVTTVFVEEVGLQANKPEAGGSVSLDVENIVIELTAENKVFHKGKEIGLSGVAPQIKRLLIEDDVPVIIRAAEQTDHGLFARVYGEAKSTGATKITFSTDL